VRITISRWFTPEHNSVAPDGIQPDVVVSRPPETPADEDPVLDAAIDHLADQPTASVPVVRTGDSASLLASGAGPVVGIVGARTIC
jgi:C-terminal processing protease CtpA/Prc